MKQIPSAPEIAVVSGDFEQFTPSEVFAFFTEATRLVQWWPDVAETDPQIGGAFCLSWPDNDWRLRGQYTSLEPGVHVGFTWAWDHEPSAGRLKQVDVWLQPLFATGSRLAIYHGPFEATESDQAAKQGIIEGWIHFGMILAGLRSGATD